MNGVAPHYVDTVSTPLIAGRDFQASDAGPARVAIVNQAMARYYFASASPIGKRVWFDGEFDPYEIVGLAGDAKYADVRAPAPPTMYIHYTRLANPPETFSVRSTVAPASMAGQAQRVLSEVLTDASVTRVTSLADQVSAAIVPERLIASVSSFFGSAGVLLAAIGVYGLLAYMVARRTKEIGVRVALGATRRDVIGLVLATAMRLLAAGLVVGIPLAVWTQPVAARMLENLRADSVLPIAIAASGTLAVGLLAAYLPARRATPVDPLVALRSD